MVHDDSDLLAAVWPGDAFVNASNVHTYYEFTGTGEPVVLLHGGICTVETFDAQTVAVGWSDGAAMAFLVAWRRPDLLRKLVYIGQNLTVDGLRPAFKARLGHLRVEHLPPMLAELYAAVSPTDPDISLRCSRHQYRSGRPDQNRARAGMVDYLGLRVPAASPERVLAMKVFASRQRAGESKRLPVKRSGLTTQFAGPGYSQDDRGR